MPTSIEITDDSIYLAKWTGLTETAATGDAIRCAFPQRTLQVRGSFGTSGKIVLEGSNDAVSWHTLTDAAGSALEFTAAGLKQIRETCIYLRPKVAEGSDVALTVILSALTRG